MIKFRRAGIRTMIAKVSHLRYRLLDALYAPVISRLTTEQYHSCRTHNDCLLAFLRGDGPTTLRQR